MRMNSLLGKQILSFLRNSDYAHPGEEEAILLTFKNISQNPQRILLDVGCGLGGTANFITNHGWGKVTGVDIDEETINFARKTYPKESFHVSDVVAMEKVLREKYDLVYSFNAFYTFPDQLAALKSMHEVTKDRAELVIFDYIDYDSRFDKQARRKSIFKPIRFPDIEKMLSQSGWKLEDRTDVTPQYRIWYQILVRRIQDKKEELLKLFGQEAFDHVLLTYTNMLHEVEYEGLGGVILNGVRSNI